MGNMEGDQKHGKQGRMLKHGWGKFKQYNRNWGSQKHNLNNITEIRVHKSII